MSRDKRMDIYEQSAKFVSKGALKAQFEQDTAIVAEQSLLFIKNIHPSYLYNTQKEIMELSYIDSDDLLDTFTFSELLVAQLIMWMICLSSLTGK